MLNISCAKNHNPPRKNGWCTEAPLNDRKQFRVKKTSNVIWLSYRDNGIYGISFKYLYNSYLYILEY